MTPLIVVSCAKINKTHGN